MVYTTVNWTCMDGIIIYYADAVTWCVCVLYHICVCILSVNESLLQVHAQKKI